MFIEKSTIRTVTIKDINYEHHTHIHTKMQERKEKKERKCLPTPPGKEKGHNDKLQIAIFFSSRFSLLKKC